MGGEAVGPPYCFFGDPGLADARFAGEQDDAAASGSSIGQPHVEVGEHPLAPDQACHGVIPPRFESRHSLAHMTARVRAPRLTGRAWLNTGGVEPDLRGRFVLLDF